MPELDGAFKEDLDGYGPELVIVGGSVVAKQILYPVLALHGCKDGAGNLGKVGKLFFKMFVFFGLGDKIHIGQGMGHFVEPYIAVGCLAGDAPHEVIPGEIDTGLIYMAHEGAGIEPVVIVIAEDEDIVKVIELEFIEAKSKLHGGGAYQDGHFGRLFYLYIMKVLAVLEKPGTEEEFALVFESKTVIISEVTGDNRMIKSLFCNKSFELMSCVEALTKRCDRTI